VETLLSAERARGDVSDDGDDDADADGPPTLDAGRGGQVALLAATVSVVAALLPWVRRPTGARTGLDLFGPLPVAVAAAVFAAVLLGGWVTATKLSVGVLGVALIAPAALVYRDAAAAPVDSPALGLFLTLLCGAAVALAGSFAVLAEPPDDEDGDDAA
jgi:hypothetical protein